MAVHPIVLFGDPILNRKAAPVTDFSKMPEIVRNLFDTMYEAEGIGLAANQIALGLRVMVVDVSGTVEGAAPTAFVNGRVVSARGRETMEEGCLSIPGVRLEVTRPAEITFEYQDELGRHFVREFSGLFARAIQHETDHLDGILITDRVGSLRRRQIKKELSVLASSSRTPL